MGTHKLVCSGSGREQARGRGEGWLWMRWRPIGFYKMWAISWLAEDLLTSQERLCTMKLIITYVFYTYTSRFLPVAAHNYSPPLRDHMVLDRVLRVSREAVCFMDQSRYVCHGNYVLNREAPLGCSRRCNLSRSSDTYRIQWEIRAPELRMYLCRRPKDPIFLPSPHPSDHKTIDCNIDIETRTP
jgi:hypothetical protein